MNFFKFLLVIATIITISSLSIEASKRHHENQQHSEGGKKARTGENKDKKASKRSNEDQQHPGGRKKARTGESIDEKNERKKEVKDDSGKEVKDDSGLDEKKRELAIVPLGSSSSSSSSVRAPQASRLLCIPAELFHLILSYEKVTSQRWQEFSMVCKAFNKGLTRAPLHIVLSNVSGDFFKKARQNSLVQGLTLETYKTYNTVERKRAIQQIVQQIDQQSVQYWKKLKMLNLSETDISGVEVATLLKIFPQLEAINLCRCGSITDEEIKDLKKQYPNLKAIDLSFTNISGIGVATLLEICPKLEKINLDHCTKVTDEGIKNLEEHYPNLKAINLRFTNISGVGVATLLKIFPQLETIYLGNITDKGIKDLKIHHSNLKAINLVNTNISGVGIATLLEIFPKLEKINLDSGKNVTDEGIKGLEKQHPHLKTIILSYTNISGVGVAKLLKICPQLEAINLYGCKKITDVGITSPLTEFQFPNLKIMNLSQTNISGVGVATLLQICPQLETINLYGCQNITDGGIKDLKEQLPNLKIIDLSQTNISGVGVAKLLKICPQLETIYLGSCKNITDEEIKDLKAQHPNLKKIILINTNISVVSIAKLLEICPQLEVIYLAWCKNVTDEGINELKTQHSNLKTINLSDTNISGVGIAKLLEICPKLETIDLGSRKNITDEEIEKLRGFYPNVRILRR